MSDPYFFILPYLLRSLATFELALALKSMMCFLFTLLLVRIKFVKSITNIMKEFRGHSSVEYHIMLLRHDTLTCFSLVHLKTHSLVSLHSE